MTPLSHHVPPMSHFSDPMFLGVFRTEMGHVPPNPPLPWNMSRTSPTPLEGGTWDNHHGWDLKLELQERQP